MRKSKRATFAAMNRAVGSSRVITIVHPERDGHAVIVVKYPKDGAGLLQAWCVDSFGVTHGEVQYGKADGYGYDKETAALSGMVIDGLVLTDHCFADYTSERLLKLRVTNGDEAAKQSRELGYYFANCGQSCYRRPGLDYLRDIGYKIITVG